MLDTTEYWTAPQDRLPEEGVPVRIITAGGMERTLTRKGSLWFAPDMSMYVYYVPLFWRLLREEEVSGC